MGLNFKKRTLLRQEVVMRCKTCNVLYAQGDKFCGVCGQKLTAEKTSVFANYGTRGITSLTYKLPNGTSVNTRAGATIPLGNGLSYTIGNSRRKSGNSKKTGKKNTK